MRKILIALCVVAVMVTGSAAATPAQRFIEQYRAVTPIAPVVPRPAMPSNASLRRSFADRAASFKELLERDADSHPFIGCDCTFTPDELDAMFLKKQVGYGGVYVRLQQETGLCPLWSAAVDAAESGHFMHQCAPNNVSGFGFNGRQYMSFASIEACLEHKSAFLAEQYLTPGGRYYHGTSLSAVCKSYNGSDYWRSLVIDVAYGMVVRGERAAAAGLSGA